MPDPRTTHRSVLPTSTALPRTGALGILLFCYTFYCSTPCARVPPERLTASRLLVGECWSGSPRPTTAPHAFQGPPKSGPDHTRQEARLGPTDEVPSRRLHGTSWTARRRPTVTVLLAVSPVSQRGPRPRTKSLPTKPTQTSTSEDLRALALFLLPLDHLVSLLFCLVLFSYTRASSCSDRLPHSLWFDIPSYWGKLDTTFPAPNHAVEQVIPLFQEHQQQALAARDPLFQIRIQSASHRSPRPRPTRVSRAARQGVGSRACEAYEA